MESLHCVCWKPLLINDEPALTGMILKIAVIGNRVGNSNNVDATCIDDLYHGGIWQYSGKRVGFCYFGDAMSRGKRLWWISPYGE